MFAKSLLNFQLTLSDNQFTQVSRVILLRLFVLALLSLFLVVFHFNYQPIASNLAVSVLIMLVFIASIISLQRPNYLSKKYALVFELAVDFSWVLVLVCLMGRSQNPFIYYYLLLTAIAAATLNSRQAWGFCLLGIVIYSTLLIIDVSEHFHHFAENYKTHLAGMWVNFVASAGVACLFISQQTRLLKQQQQALAEERETNLKNEQLIGIATISANALHNLSTPIATMSLITDELLEENSLDKNTLDKEAHDDLLLMQQQISRCQKSMAELSLLAEQGTEKNLTSVDEFIEVIKTHYLLNSPNFIPNFVSANEPDGTDKVLINNNVLVQYALINLINNSIESSIETPTISVEILENTVDLRIENQSNLSSQDIVQRWGKPFKSSKTGGMGIGSFLANSTIEKQGGSVAIETELNSAETNQSKIIVTVCLPKEDLQNESKE